MPVSSGIAQARRCAGKRIVTSGFKPTMESFTRGNSLSRVNHRLATSTTGHCGAAISSRGQLWTVRHFINSDCRRPSVNRLTVSMRCLKPWRFSQHHQPLRVRSAAMGRSRTLPGPVIVERQVQEGLLERALLEREDLCSLTVCCVAVCNQHRAALESTE